MPVCDCQSVEHSHFEHFVTCCSPFVSPEFVVELVGMRALMFLYMLNISYILHHSPPQCRSNSNNNKRNLEQEKK